MHISLSKIIFSTRARLAQGSTDTVIHRVHTDTRTTQPGDLFVALAGDRYDAHDFIDQAIERGASALCLSRPPLHSINKNIPIILVEDTLKALQQIAAEHRRTLPARVIAIVGSNGKTSTKEMLAQLLSRRFTIAQTQANYNNHIGVPLTLLSITPAHAFAVVEIGTNHPGEIAPLAHIAKPDLAIITNIGREHLEFFKTQEAVAREEASVLSEINSDGEMILNADDPWTAWIRQQYPTIKTTLTALHNTDTHWRAEIHSSTLHSTHFTLHSPEGSLQTHLPSPAKFLIHNALQAAAAASWAGLSLPEIQAGIQHLHLPDKRMQIISLPDNRFIINDCYNANPDSMIAALDTLHNLTEIPHKAAILGSMAELGDATLLSHRQIGEIAASHKLNWIIAIGPHAQEIQDGALAQGYPTHAILTAKETSQAIQPTIHRFAPDTALLVKGSRSVALETITQAIQNHFNN
jgi:UDP-N-acetylmuramoyl-tripeptide--D-alanyl-D-alanine ligase